MVTPPSGEMEGAVVFVSLPGVPHEMKGLMEKSVIPKLKKKFSLPAIVHKTLLTAGQGESAIADILVKFEKHLPNHIKLAYLPAYGMVRLRLTANGKDKNELEAKVDTHFKKLKKLVKKWLVSDEDILIADALGKILDEKKKFIASAESCTGGYIAHLLTSRSGASRSFKGSVVSYSNQSKENVLGVKHFTIAKHGAVSEETVTEMVQGVLDVMKVDYAVATSGIMGPDGGTKMKPVGTVWIAVANNKTVYAKKFFFRFDRRRNIELTAHTALNMLRLFVLEQEG